MADAYWSYSDPRYSQQQGIPPIAGKRPRSNFDISTGQELPNYNTRGDDRGAVLSIRDSDSIGGSYELYLQNRMVSSYGRQAARPMNGVSNGPVDELRVVSVGNLDPGITMKERMGVGSGRPVPPDASSTLFVEGLPSDCTRREVAHIFRPFVGYKEVRLVSKESRRPGGEPLILCFVDFLSPAHATTAMDALQGYKFDVHDRDSVNLRLQYARHPGARSGGGHRGKR